MADKKKVLIIIDMQNDFISGSLANPAAAAIVKPICDFIGRFKGEIYCTRDTHDEDYLKSPEGIKLPVEHCIEETAGWCVHDDILKALRGKDFDYVDKPTFGYDDWDKGYLDSRLRLSEIYICGTCTDICVVSNALLLKAKFPKANIYILEDLCAGLTKELHDAAIKVMSSCQCNICKAEDIK